jgi:5-methylcytosine-specific restriction endonuclease McrA
MYSDVINDPKVMRLPEAMRWHWVAVLCCSAKNDGQVPPTSDLAFMLRMKETATALILAELHAAGLLDMDETGFHPHNWDDRQFKSDTSNERVKKYREKRAAAGLPQMGDYSVFRPALIQRDGEQCVYCRITSGLVVDHMEPITLGGTDHIDNLALACKPCNSGKSGRTPEQANMTVTVQSASDALRRYRDSKRDVTVTVTPPEQSRTETDTKAEQTAAAPPRSRKKPVRSVPDDFAINATNLSYAKALGFSEFEIRREHQKFVMHAKAKGLSYADWDAAEHNWLTKAAEFAGKRPRGEIDIADDGLIEVLDQMQLEAWDGYNIALNGKPFPRNKKGGWRFPSKWPPGYELKMLESVQKLSS